MHSGGRSDDPACVELRWGRGASSEAGNPPRLEGHGGWDKGSAVSLTGNKGATVGSQGVACGEVPRT